MHSTIQALSISRGALQIGNYYVTFGMVYTIDMYNIV